MQALVFRHPAADTSATEVARIGTPRPAAGEVTIEVEYAGINFKDVMSRRGDPGYVADWPFVPGIEVAGRVREVGPGVTDVEVGQPVLALTNAGGLAQVATAKAALTVGVPAGVEHAVAAAVPGALTTAELLLHHFARIRSGDVVLAHSAGGSVGRAIAQLATLTPGVRLIGVVGADSRRSVALQAGYEAAITRGAGLATVVLAHTGGRGVDVVFDPQGTAWLEQDLESLAPGGKVFVFGNAGGDSFTELPPLGQLFARNCAIGGFSLAGLAHHHPRVVAEAMASVLTHLETGCINLQVTVLAGLENAAAAQQALADGSAITKQVVKL
ncbi:zinc-binding dehydrogenase [Nakamurella sp. A5-74]|uniref:Zinc-binding dehydrogenase n=1 Tax=Nakamurella sp. A5-74 TaxID=3158264 RepID=A0AAU8DTP8_9ACTN